MAKTRTTVKAIEADLSALEAEVAALRKEVAALKKALSSASKGGADPRVDKLIEFLKLNVRRKRLMEESGL